ncbi:hypothetical protein NOVO_03085 [Rickettsiales bacterium Ac37b]|nr:hypothetical protein NOVO_03085 [Rickettsiales bacterium Ac37b]
MTHYKLSQILLTYSSLLENIVKQNNITDLISFISTMQINTALAFPRGLTIAIYDNEKQKYNSDFNHICFTYIIKFVIQYKSYELLNRLIILQPNMFIDYLQDTEVTLLKRILYITFKQNSLYTALKDTFNKTLTPIRSLSYFNIYPPYKPTIMNTQQILTHHIYKSKNSFMKKINSSNKIQLRSSI